MNKKEYTKLFLLLFSVVIIISCNSELNIYEIAEEEVLFPEVIHVSIDENEIVSTLSPEITIQFSEKMDKQSVLTGLELLNTNSEVMTVSHEWLSDSVLSIHVVNVLAYDTYYQLYIYRKAESKAGFPFKKDFKIGFTTFSDNSPTLEYKNIPATIECEDYNTGGEGVAYHDTTPDNQGGEYRYDDVDIGITHDGRYFVGWIFAGEWLTYTINVERAAKYKFDIRAAMKDPGSREMRLYLDDFDIAGPIQIESTGDYDSWRIITLDNIFLERGKKVLKIYAVGYLFNLDYIDISYDTTTSDIPGKIECEDYNAGGQGVAYYDTTPGNEGGKYRNDDVGIEVCEEGGYNIGWAFEGEWITYDVVVTESGNYALDIRIATAMTTIPRFHIEIDDNDITGPVEVAYTGGYQIWKTITINDINLVKGNHVLKIVMDGNLINFDYIEFY